MRLTVGRMVQPSIKSILKRRLREPWVCIPTWPIKGVKVSLGGDPPGSVVEETYPIWLFQQAMTLQQPGRPELRPFPPMRQRFTIDNALESMTVTAAWQLGMEDKIGSIEVGKYADFAIFNKSLREILPHNLVDESRVLATILNGEFTFDGRKLTDEEWDALVTPVSNPDHPFGCDVHFPAQTEVYNSN